MSERVMPWRLFRRSASRRSSASSPEIPPPLPQAQLPSCSRCQRTRYRGRKSPGPTAPRQAPHPRETAFAWHHPPSTSFLSPASAPPPTPARPSSPPSQHQPPPRIPPTATPSPHFLHSAPSSPPSPPLHSQSS